ncbi:MAG TPA: DUF99 family protein [Methanoregula sp.]|nr:DUF99 family protein [Methanoregula sp.]
MHIPKKGLRALGIAESYSGRAYSTLAGVVMRKDLIIDGFAFSRVTVAGMDGTDAVLKIVGDLNRSDINFILLSGGVIAFFNIIDPQKVQDRTRLPVICVTYENSEGLLADIRHHFPGDIERMDAYLRLGDRMPYTLPSGQIVYLRSWGIDPADAGRLCTAFTCQGKIPEPLRVARLSARAVHGFVKYEPDSILKS